MAHAAPWTARVLTLYPEMFPGPLGHSLAGKALGGGLWRLDAIDIRSFANDRHRTVDDEPFGGGPGMVMRPDVIDAALDGALDGGAGGDGARGDGAGGDGAGDDGDGPALPVVYLTPRGRVFDQARARALAAGPGVILLCGRFEGVDERVIRTRSIEEVSLGDFVLSGGEPAALALLDACVRLLPGVVGTAESLDVESFEQDLLEYPHYTRPQQWRGLGVPETLLSGHHERIRAWRLAEAEKLTRERRPDLWARYVARKS